MNLTKNDILKNIKDLMWIKYFIIPLISDKMKIIGKKSSYWESDRQGVPAETGFEKFNEKGIVLWAFDVQFETRTYKRWKEIVIFESGEIRILSCHHSHGVVKADFEYYAGFNDHSAVDYSLSEEDFEMYKEMITEKLLLILHDMPYYEYLDSYEKPTRTYTKQ